MYSTTCDTIIPDSGHCTIQCLPGYNVTGPSTTSCSYGNLDTQTCTESPCIVTKDPFGYLGSCSTDPFGTSVTVASQVDCQINCTAGFVVKGSLTRCVKGVLTSQYCAPAPCPNIQAPINGTLGNCPSSLSSGMTCDFVCNAGAQLEGPGAGSPPACVATPCSYLINGRTWWAYAIAVDSVHTARWMTLSQAHSNLADVMLEAVGAGGHLVTIDSVAVQTFVDLHWSGYTTWIGLQRVSGCDPTQSGVAAGVQSTQCWNVAQTPNYWNWGSLNTLTLAFDTNSYSHWSSGEPNNFGGVETAAINLANKGGWNDVDPTRPFYGIIEIHTSPDVTDGILLGWFIRCTDMWCSSL